MLAAVVAGDNRLVVDAAVLVLLVVVVVVVVVVLLLLLLLVVVVVVAACAFKAAIKVYWVMRKPFLTRTSPPHTLHHTKCPHNLQSRFTGFRRSFV